MSGLFSRLEELAVRLNQTSDSLNETIKAVEAKLASLRVGVEAWLEAPIVQDPVVDKDGSKVGEIHTYFGYGRVNGTWRLLVTKFNDEFDPLEQPLSIQTPVPLQQAPREIRVKALQQLPELVKQLESKAEVTLKEIEKARSLANSL